MTKSQIKAIVKVAISNDGNLSDLVVGIIDGISDLDMDWVNYEPEEPQLQQKMEEYADFQAKLVTELQGKLGPMVIEAVIDNFNLLGIVDEIQSSTEEEEEEEEEEAK